LPNELKRSGAIYIWWKSATPGWLRENESRLLELTFGACAVIERPSRERLLLEAPCRSRVQAQQLLRAFGGRIEKLPRRWLDQFLRPTITKPIRIGTRLVIRNAGSNVGGALTPRLRVAASGSWALQRSSHILAIPAEAAFGTGEHATTAMTLRLLEETTRRLTNGWSMLDAGTGSGILALAGKRFGAAEVIAIDNDPMAISTAKRNARANGISGVKFIVGDLTNSIDAEYDIITANLYSELLVSVVPSFGKSLGEEGRLILSGVLREQEPRLMRALRSNGFQVHETRRRGKWIALLAAHSVS